MRGLKPPLSQGPHARNRERRVVTPLDRHDLDPAKRTHNALQYRFDVRACRVLGGAGGPDLLEQARWLYPRGKTAKCTLYILVGLRRQPQARWAPLHAAPLTRSFLTSVQHRIKLRAPLQACHAAIGIFPRFSRQVTFYAARLSKATGER